MSIKTFDIGRGVRYAKVVDRLKEFHKKFPDAMIQHESKEIAGGVRIKALVFSHHDLLRPDFTGSAWVSVEGLKRQKAWEKAETIATGRALAFLGLHADGAIATAEEMEDIEDGPELTALRLDIEEMLYQAKTIDGDPNIDAIANNYSTYDSSRCTKALRYLRDAIDEKRVADGNLTAKERNEKVSEKLSNDKA
jgi:hypothetical protein